MPENFGAEQEKPKTKLEKNVDRFFNQGELLYGDVLNAWTPLAFIDTSDQIDRLKPLPLYEQHYVEKGARDVETIRKSFGEKEAIEYEQYFPIETQRIVELSDPEQIKKYDSLVDEFNNDLARIKEEKDLDKVKEFYKRAEEIIRAKK